MMRAKTSSTLPKLRIWLVEDEPDQAKALRRLIDDAIVHNANHDYATFGADLELDSRDFANGAEVIAAFEAEGLPDIIIADLLTPKAEDGGYAIFQWFTHKDCKIALRDRPLLVFTSARREDAEGLIVETAEADWVPFIPKPKIEATLATAPHGHLLAPDNWLANLAWVVFRRHSQGWRSRFHSTKIDAFNVRALSSAWRELWGNLLLAADQPLVILDGGTPAERAWIANAIHAHSSRDRLQYGDALATGPWSVLQTALIGPNPYRNSRGLLELHWEGTLFLDSLDQAFPETAHNLLPLFRDRALAGSAVFRPVGKKSDYAFRGTFILGIDDFNAWCDESSPSSVAHALRDTLHAFHVEIPNLPMLKQDIPAYAALLLEDFRPGSKFLADTAPALENYHWPGGYIELQRLIRGLLKFKSTFSLSDLPAAVRAAALPVAAPSASALPVVATPPPSPRLPAPSKAGASVFHFDFGPSADDPTVTLNGKPLELGKSWTTRVQAYSVLHALIFKPIAAPTTAKLAGDYAGKRGNRLFHAWSVNSIKDYSSTYRSLIEKIVALDSSFAALVRPVVQPGDKSGHGRLVALTGIIVTPDPSDLLENPADKRL